MESEIVLDPMVLDWECRRRTNCCRSWRIDVAPAALREMALRCAEAGDHPAALRLMRQHPEEQRLDGSCALPLDEDGSCMFLRGSSCTYRVQHGVETLPQSCSKFPYLGLLTPKRALYGLSFLCPTALALLGHRADLELWAGRDISPPTKAACDFRGLGTPELAGAAEAFWDVHWQWFEFVRAGVGPAPARLGELAQRASGQELPVLELEEAFWSASRWDGRVGARLLAAGGVEAVLRSVYDDERAVVAQPELGGGTAAADLLDRYLLHRLMVPEFLITGASLARLLGGAFAAVARFRIELGRGNPAGSAIMEVDRLLLHSDFLPRLFPADVDESDVWRTLALLALAR